MVDEVKKQKDLTTKKQLLNEALDRAMEDGTMAEVKELKKRLREMSPPPEILKKIFEKRRSKNKKDGVISFEELEKNLKRLIKNFQQ